MKKKVWLTKDHYGYDLYKTRPIFNDGYKTWSTGSTVNQSNLIIGSLCPELVEQWFGLKKHLRRETCIRGTFSVSFTPDPPKRSRANKKGK